MVAVQLKAHEAQGHFIHSESSTDCFANITCQCNFASLVFLLPAFTCEMVIITQLIIKPIRW